MKIKSIISALLLVPIFCWAQPSVVITYNNSVLPYDFHMGACYGNCINVKAVVTGGTPPYSYTWQANTVTTADTFTYCKGTYGDTLKVVVSDANGNGNGTAVMVKTDYLPWQYFCMATVDNATGKNMLIWNQTTDNTIISYNIYKETTAAGVYAVIKNIPRTSFSTFIDTASNPAQKANRYKLTAIDTCGTESNVSVSYDLKTIHLTINAGSGTNWNLAWDNAEGFLTSKFKIWRGTNPSNMVVIDSIQSSLNSYTDLNAPSGQLNYQLEAITNVNCSPSTKTTSNTYQSSFSNSVANFQNGINQIDNQLSGLKIYPNPACTVIQLAVSNEQLVETKVFDVLGKEVLQSKQSSIDVSTLANGVYFVQVKTIKGISTQKIIVQH